MWKQCHQISHDLSKKVSQIILWTFLAKQFLLKREACNFYALYFDLNYSLYFCRCKQSSSGCQPCRHQATCRYQASAVCEPESAKIRIHFKSLLFCFPSTATITVLISISVNLKTFVQNIAEIFATYNISFSV